MPGRTTAQGYGTAHQRLRAQWTPYVQAGVVHCWRCGEPIEPGTRWHLGHDDHDRTQYRGPEHERCNVSTRTRERDQARAGDPAPTPRTRWGKA